MMNRIKIRLVMGVLCYWQVMAVEPYHDYKIEQDVVLLNFDRLFPDSPFKQVYSECLNFWQDLIATRSGSLSDEQREYLHGLFIDNLIALHSRVSLMLHSSAPCSPDDIEFLSGLLQRIKSEHTNLIRNSDKKESICSIVLLDRLKTKLEQLLEYDH